MKGTRNGRPRNLRILSGVVLKKRGFNDLHRLWLDFGMIDRSNVVAKLLQDILAAC